jgi:hypothetical protein
MTYGNCDVVGHRFARKTLPSWSVLSQTVFMRQETDYKLPSNSRWMHKSGESVASFCSSADGIIPSRRADLSHQEIRAITR